MGSGTPGKIDKYLNMETYFNTIGWAGQEEDAPPSGVAPEVAVRCVQERRRRLVWAIGCMLFAIVLSGCESLNYYGQLVVGQVRIFSNRQPIAELVTDPTVPEGLKSEFERILEVRKFAETELYLPADAHYLSYVDLQRPFAVWNVYAAPEFSLQPKIWRYPVIGHAAYRGFFSEDAATTYAKRLATRGYDTHVGGAVAYSTLGWFADPVFNTMLGRSPAGIAALIFHELAHQILYVPDDTAFNEGFASTVEQEGVRRWLEKTDDMASYRRFLQAKQHQKAFFSLVQACRKRLDVVYGLEMDPQGRRAQKTAAFRAFLKDYENLKRDRNAISGYDDWVYGTALNNAKLISLAVYRDYVPAFLEVLRAADDDLQKFYADCRSLASLPKDERDRRLTALLKNHSGPYRDVASDAE